MREAFLGRRRFEEFQSALDAPRAVLTARLKRLCDEGMLERVEYQSNPPRFEYRLTPKGSDVLGRPRRDVAVGQRLAVAGRRWIRRSC